MTTTPVLFLVRSFLRDLAGAANMHCRRCNIHFPGEPSGGRCPSCGERGGATSRHGPAEAARAVLVAPTPGRPARSDERTRTERLPPDPWSPGTRIAGKYEVVGPL